MDKKTAFRVWALQQDIFRREDIADRCKDPEHRAAVLENIRRDREELARLLEGGRPDA